MSVGDFLYTPFLPETELAVYIDAFTIRAVAQDEFDDVKVPDEPAQAPRAGVSTNVNGPLIR